MVVRQRFELTDEQWAKLRPALPPQKAATGRPAADHRRIINAILWVIRTGAPWRDLPERYGPIGTVTSRFYRWRKSGLWDRVFAQIQTQADGAGCIDWDIHFVDGTVVRAHQHAAGAKGGTPLRKRSATAGAASRPRSTSEPKAAASS
jgi:transposase